MNKLKPHLLEALLMAVLLLGSLANAGAQVATNWIVFNDHVPGATAANANTYNLRGVPGTPPEPVEGFLKDYVTGLPTPAYIISTAVGTPDSFGTMAQPNAGTPAYNLFNGIVDVGNVNSGIGLRANAPSSVTLTFSNLNPTQRYIFRGTSARGGNYLRRWTLASLRGADSFVDAHTAGVYTRANFPTGTMTNGQASYDSGENRADGALVGWDEIDPGLDGVITITCQQYVDDPLPNGQTPDLGAYGYGFNSIYLVEVGAPVPVTITSNPPPNVVVGQNRPLSLSGLAQGSPHPTYQWYRNGAEIFGATAHTYSVATAQSEDAGDYYLVARNNFNAATSSVAHVTVINDTVGPVLASVKTDDTFRRVILTWDENLANDPTTELGNYTITDSQSNPINVLGATHNGNVVILNVDPLTPSSTYTIEVDYQQDLVGNPTLTVGNPTYDPNGVVTTFRSWVISPGFSRFQAFYGLPAGQNIAAFTAMGIYPEGDTFEFYTNTVFWPQTANPNVEQYAMRFTGLFVAPETGTHHFDVSHDDDMLLRFYPTEAPSGAPTELAAACCTGLTGGPTLDVDMVAGQRYYYELIVREFGGGDNAGFAVTLPSGAIDSPVHGQYLAIAVDPATAPNVGIAQQPQSQTVLENHEATFSVVATNVGSSGAAYQWQRGPGGGSGFTNIPGAFNATYTSPLLSQGDSGNEFRVIVLVPGTTVTSVVAVVTVSTDAIAPQVARVHGSRNLASVNVVFNEVMSPGSLGEVSNYELRDGGNNVLALTDPVIAGDNRSVRFTTPVQTPGASYTLTIQDVADAAGNLMSTTNVLFRAYVLSPGFLVFEAYNTGGGNLVSDLRAHPSFPNSPDTTAYITAFDSRNVYPTDSRENYGARISGYFTPAETGNYGFYFRADDGAELRRSPDSNPQNSVVLLENATCCLAFSANAATNALEAGTSYYLELLYKEGTGGDYGQVAVRRPGDITASDSLTTGRGTDFSALADPVGASITITQQPANQSFVLASGAATLSSNDLNANDGGYTVTTPTGPMEGPWTYNSGTGSWIYEGQTNENNHANTSILTTPTYNVTALGNLVITLSHRYSFESGSWDGGVIRVSKNGGAFVTVPVGDYLQNGYNGTVTAGNSQLSGQRAWVNESAGHGANVKVTSIANLGLYVPGDTVAVQFYASSDTNTDGNDPDWEIDSVVITQGNSPANSVSFTVGADAVNVDGPNPPRFYQWYRNNGAGFVAIAGANSATYTLNLPTLADNGAVFRALVSIPGANTTSSSATLTVGTGSTAPVLSTSRNPGTGAITITWTGSGVLQHADELLPNGAGFTDVPGNPSSGVVIQPTASKKFYRIR